MQTSSIASISGPFNPVLNNWWKSLIEKNPDKLFEYIEHYGSPLNLISLESFRNNIDEIKDLFNKENIEYKIFYGAKVNKSVALIKESYLAEINIDVSSIYEYKDALLSGFNGSNIIVTGPVKPNDFLIEIVKNKSLISIDSIEEYYDLKNILKSNNLNNHPILVRFKPSFEMNSRFGMSASTISKLLTDISTSKEFSFLGFHFHLSGYDVEPRVQAIRELFNLIDLARSNDIKTSLIDIGGGLPVKYVDNDNYNYIVKNISDNHFINGCKPLSYYPYGGFLTALDWLREFLNSNLEKSLKIKDWLTANNLSLCLEPGRALVDQTCITVFQIERVKPLQGNNHVIFVKGSSFSACETWFNSEFLVDPILISKNNPSSENKCLYAYIAGHSCLSEDVITQRLLKFSVIPQKGDLVVFINTGGYQMDLLENEFHRHPMPVKLVIDKDFSSALVDR